MPAKKVWLSHNLIYARNGLFRGLARLVGRGAARGMDGGTTVFNQQQRAIDTPLPAEALVTALEKHGGVAPQNVQMTQ